MLFRSPARAPSGGKNWTGGRTIAALQEEDFDKRLLHLQLCYGVSLVADQCTLERRRVCKAILVHELEKTLEAPGHFLKDSVEFHCEDTALNRSGLDFGSVSLKPNGEIAAIQSTLREKLEARSPTESAHFLASGACQFLTDCKWAMKPSAFSLRKIASCALTTNPTHRTVLLNEVGAMVFGGKKAVRRRTLYPSIMETSEN